MRPKHVVLGCLAPPLLLLVVALAVVTAALLLGPIDSDPTSAELQQELPLARQAPVVLPDSLSPNEGGLAAYFDFEEGLFEVRPGAVGEPIRIEAEYDRGSYQLEQIYRTDLPDGDRFELTFERTASLAGLRQLLHRAHQADNHVIVFLPPDIVFDLDIKMRKGAAQLDLSGLSLRSLTLDTGMGSTEVNIGEPNRVIMQACELQAAMGELRVTGLGFAAPRSLRFQGRMGDFRLDFDGDWQHSTNAVMEVMMGDLRIDVPPSVQLEHERSGVLFGEVESRGNRRLPPAEGDSKAKILWLDSRVRFGSLRID